MFRLPMDTTKLTLRGMLRPIAVLTQSGSLLTQAHEFLHTVRQNTC